MVSEKKNDSAAQHNLLPLLMFDLVLHQSNGILKKIGVVLDMPSPVRSPVFGAATMSSPDLFPTTRYLDSRRSTVKFTKKLKLTGAVNAIKGDRN